MYVCQDWFPLKKGDRRKSDGFWMDDLLLRQIDVLLKNVVKDWDFTIIISGQGEMRVGKSVLAMQIGAYWTYELEKRFGIKVPFNVKENFVLNGNELMQKGNQLGEKYKYSVLVFDEAADDLESTKVLKATTQAIKDYLRKAAQFNMLNIIVQSEFFELPKAIAISRSMYLIDVSYTIDEVGLFERGSFDFYSKRRKKYLYLKGKKDLNYHAQRSDFKGAFSNFYPVDEAEYRQEKADSLKRWKHMTAAELRWREWLRGALSIIYQTGKSHREIADDMNSISDIRIHHSTIGRILKKEKFEVENEENGE
ncbi:hypothetical protein LCGC14_0732140 [marine sediment metagenome]|uniref:Zona occludens toxin N-terminal domain-containing protein n=1 Tax=marine sediment metagenome TaxID=412755 RepID=A0A0F9TGI7_9ZZZZ